MSLPYEHRLIERARKLRKEATRQENHLWYDFLKNYPQRFQRQKAIGSYIVDFYCHSVKLVVDIDGSQHYDEDGLRYDKRRTGFLNEQGLTVLRFTNIDIDKSFEGVCMEINKIVCELLEK